MQSSNLFILLFPGLVLAPATGHVGADCEHSPGNNVLQDAYIASTECPSLDQSSVTTIRNRRHRMMIMMMMEGKNYRHTSQWTGHADPRSGRWLADRIYVKDLRLYVVQTRRRVTGWEV